MSLARELILHPEQIESALRQIAKEVIRSAYPNRQHFDARVRKDISHPFHQAGKTKEELATLQRTARFCFHEECKAAGVGVPGKRLPPAKKEGGLSENLYTK